MPTQEAAPTSGVSEHQLDFFRTFGYLVLPRFFSPEEVATIGREVDQAMQEQYSHRPYDGSQRHWTLMMDDDTPFFASLLEDPRLLSMAKQLYGEDVLGILTDANRYTGNSGWHRDTSTVRQYGIKFAFYLEPVDAATGALRVLPSSHRYPDDPEMNSLMSRFSIGEVPAQALKSEPGDVVAFDLRTWHASLGGSRDRRMCTCVYYADPKTADEQEVVRKLGAQNVEYGIKLFGCKRPFLYSRHWMSNPQDSPDRRHWIERLRRIGFFDPPGVVEA